MHDHLVMLFALHIEDCCSYGLSGAEQRRAPSASVDDIWNGIHTTLSGAAGASKVLWGESARTRAARAPLRAAFEAENSPIESKVLRNHFEHFHERIERWWARPGSKNFMHRNIGPLESLGDQDARDVLMHFDEDAEVVYYLGEPFELAPIEAEMQRLLDLAPRVIAEARRGY